MTKRTITSINPIYYNPGTLNLDIYGTVTAALWIERMAKEIHAPLSEIGDTPGGVLEMLDELGLLPAEYAGKTRVAIIREDPTRFFETVMRPNERTIIEAIIQQRPQWVQEPQPTPWQVLEYYA